MKKIVFLIFALMIIPTSFAFSTKELCNNLQQITITMDENTNLTEFPTEILELVNEQISQDTALTESLNEIDKIEFRAEIYYNSSICFSGSFLFNDSELEFFRLFSENETENTISFKLELYTLDSVITDWTNMETKEVEPLEYVKLMLNSLMKMVKGLLNGDIIITPIKGIFKAFKAITVFAKLNLQSISQNMSGLQS